MAFSDVVKTQFDAGSVQVADGTTPTALSATVRLDQGNFQLQGLMEDLREATVYETRGKMASVRKAGRTYPTLSFSALVAEFTEATTGTLLDLIMGWNNFSARVTTLGRGDVMTFDVTFTMEGTDYGDAADHVIVCKDVHISADFAEGDPNTLTFNGTVYGEITIDGETINAPTHS